LAIVEPDLSWKGDNSPTYLPKTWEFLVLMTGTMRRCFLEAPLGVHPAAICLAVGGKRGPIEFADDAKVVQMASQPLPLGPGGRRQMRRTGRDGDRRLRLVPVERPLARIAMQQLDRSRHGLAAAHQARPASLPEYRTMPQTTAHRFRSWSSDLGRIAHVGTTQKP
jgi:hypothetical protein